MIHGAQRGFTAGYVETCGPSWDIFGSCWSGLGASWWRLSHIFFQVAGLASLVLDRAHLITDFENDIGSKHGGKIDIEASWR